MGEERESVCVWTDAGVGADADAYGLTITIRRTERPALINRNTFASMLLHPCIPAGRVRFGPSPRLGYGRVHDGTSQPGAVHHRPIRAPTSPAQPWPWYKKFTSLPRSPSAVYTLSPLFTTTSNGIHA